MDIDIGQKDTKWQLFAALTPQIEASPSELIQSCEEHQFHTRLREQENNSNIITAGLILVETYEVSGPSSRVKMRGKSSALL